MITSPERSLPCARPVLASVLFWFALLATAQVHAAGPRLHVPSPDWRDQIVYFVLTDRFNDGDPSNNDQGAGEYDPGNNDRFNGGDLQGIADRIDYIRGLGATAVWLTPPVANQWIDPGSGTTGYHGYWAENFMQVDRHAGKLADYQRLSSRLHKAGMFLVQDIVLNHTGNFFAYRGGWDAADPTRFFHLNTGARPAAPSQPPFDQNDARDPRQRRAGIYHWTPDINDYGDATQLLNFQMAGLDDLNTENPVVRRALRRSYGHWIRSVGVDAFRVDTAFYVPPELFNDFLHSRDPAAPGIAQVARQTGRRRFHVFGEGFGIDKPYADEQVRRIERYMTSADGRALLPGMLDFPLYGTLGDVFARGRPTAELGWRIENTMARHRRPHLMPTFVDNHDVDRFLATGSHAALQQSLLAIMTLPGIPTIYYGTEQGFTERRAAMFKAGYGSGGSDHFDIHAPLYRFIARVSALRRANKVFSRGTPTVLAVNRAGAGALAWRMTHGRTSALVVFNSAETPALVDHLATGLPVGTRLAGLFGIAGTPAATVVGSGGEVSLELPARSGQVWTVVGRSARRPAASPQLRSMPKMTTLTLAPLPAAAVSGDFEISGSASGLDRFKLVVDGDLASAQRVTPGPDGRWRATIDTSRMVDPAVRHSVVAWSDAPVALSGRGSFQVERAWSVLADVADPPADDAGPAGGYVYPTESGYGTNRPMDLRRVRVSGAGGALRIDLTMHKLSTAWNPPNGFDHVAFTIFIELPGRDGGATIMPLQNARVPTAMHWHYRLRAHGWSNALFSAAGATATNEGTPVTPTADIRVDAATGTVSFILPAAALGAPVSLSGLKLYVTTWDYDGGYRALTPEPQPWSIGGGNPATDALVMDASPLITLP